MNPEQTKKTYALKGLGVSPGVVIGKAYLFDPLDSNVSFYKLKKTSLVPKEVERFKDALKESEKQLKLKHIAQKILKISLSHIFKHILTMQN